MSPEQFLLNEKGQMTKTRPKFRENFKYNADIKTRTVKEKEKPHSASDKDGVK